MSDKIKILLADDEDDVKTTLKIYLTKCGYEVDTAYDGLDTLDRIKNNKPNLIFLDIMMPLVDGIEVCKKIKKDKGTEDIKIVMLSAASTKEAYIRAKEAGADDFIVKPFEYSSIDNILKKFFNT